MGHIRLGILPKTRQWSAVMDCLADPEVPADQVANTVLDSAMETLASSSARTTVSYCVWLLSQLVLRSKLDDFATALGNLGIRVNERTNATEFVARASRVASDGLSLIQPYTALTTISGMAFRETLTRTVGIYGNTLFGSSLPEVQSAFRKYATGKQFSELLHIYFSAFLSRLLRFVVDKEIANHLGPHKRFTDLSGLTEFEAALELFAGQTTRIVDTFSGGWYSKQMWQQGTVSQDDAARFVYVALKKLRADLGLEDLLE